MPFLLFFLRFTPFVPPFFLKKVDFEGFSGQKGPLKKKFACGEQVVLSRLAPPAPLKRAQCCSAWGLRSPPALGALGKIKKALQARRRSVRYIYIYTRAAQHLKGFGYFGDSPQCFPGHPCTETVPTQPIM